jgi:hypothetical protein
MSMKNKLMKTRGLNLHVWDSGILAVGGESRTRDGEMMSDGNSTLAPCMHVSAS